MTITRMINPQKTWIGEVIVIFRTINTDPVCDWLTHPLSSQPAWGVTSWCQVKRSLYQACRVPPPTPPPPPKKKNYLNGVTWISGVKLA